MVAVIVFVAGLATAHAATSPLYYVMSYIPTDSADCQAYAYIGPSWPNGLVAQYLTPNWCNTEAQVAADLCSQAGYTTVVTVPTLAHVWNKTVTSRLQCSKPDLNCSYTGPISWAPACSASGTWNTTSGSNATINNTAAWYTGSQIYSCSNGVYSYVSGSCSAIGTVSVSSNISSSWTITGPATITGSGTTQTSTSKPTGTYTITWGAVAGYVTPVSQSLTLTPGGTISFSGTYSGLPCTYTGTVPWAPACSASGTWNTPSGGFANINNTAVGYNGSIIYSCLNGAYYYVNGLCDINSYTVSATAGAGGTISPASRAVGHGSTTTFTVTPNAGYTASVTGCGGSLVGSTYTTGAITGACTVSATFTPKSYTVSTSAVGGGSILPTSIMVSYGSKTNINITPNIGNTPSVTGCGGSLSGSTYTTGIITGDCTVSATFYTSYTFDSNGGIPSYATVNQVAGTTVASPGNPTRAGYTFAGWSPALPRMMPGSGGGSIAQWTAIPTYNYTFNSNGGTPSYATVNQVSGTTVASPGTPTRAGYTFTGWSPALPTTMPVGGGGSTAQWTAIPTYNYTFNSNGGTPSYTTVNQASGTTVSSPGTPTRAGYTFTGWSPALPTTMPVGGGGSTAQWTLNSYTVSTSANSSGTISPASRTINHGDTTTFTVTPNAGYTASVTGCGGSLSGTTYTTGAITGACTVNATFSINSYTVSVSAGSWGTVSPLSQTVSHGNTTTFTVTPSIGYVASVTGCGGSLSGTTYTTGAITGACTVSVIFTATNTSTSPTIIINPTTYYAGVSNTYTFTATDLQGDQVRYGIDWNMDGSADDWLPAFPGYVNSGTSRSMSYTWPTTGNKQFQALTQDFQGLNSAWTVRNITVTDAPCANNAINPPTCTQCANNIAYANGNCVFCSTGGCTGTPGGNSTNGNSTLTCNSGAINIPSCSLCPGGQTLVGSMCVNNCTNGATNPTACDACPAGQELIGGICTVTTTCGDATCNGSETILTCPADCKMKYQQF